MLSAFAWWYRGRFLVYYKHAEFGIVINPCTAESGYWQEHAKLVTATDALFPLYEEP